MDNKIQRNIDNIQNGANKKASFNFKDVRVFTMPKGMKRPIAKSSSDADDAKKTGFIILIVGFIFLLIILSASYYFLVMKPNSQKINSNSKAPVQEKTEDKKVETKLASEKKETIPEKNSEKIITKKPETKKEETSNNEISTKSNPEKTEENKEPEEEIVVEEKKEEKPVVNIIDKDMDKLSSAEELILGTSDTSPDTDNDGYNDLAEMLSGYNPLGEGTIDNNENFKNFSNNHYHFSFLYPSRFVISASTDDSLILDLGNQEFFQIFIEPNKNKYSIEDWYKKQFGVNVIDQSLISKKGDWNVVKNADLKSYFFKSDRDDYVIAYNYSSADDMNYANIFEIVFNTFKMTE